MSGKWSSKLESTVPPTVPDEMDVSAGEPAVTEAFSLFSLSSKMSSQLDVILKKVNLIQKEIFYRWENLI